MPANTSVPIDHNAPLDVNFVSKSPHVVVYRLWRQLPQASWEICADGDSSDEVSDHHELSAMPAGSKVAYWLGIGGNPNTHYRALVTMAQGGRILDSGSFVEQGSTNAHGVAEANVVIELT